MTVSKGKLQIVTSEKAGEGIVVRIDHSYVHAAEPPAGSAIGLISHILINLIDYAQMMGSQVVTLTVLNKVVAAAVDGVPLVLPIGLVQTAHGATDEIVCILLAQDSKERSYFI